MVKSASEVREKMEERVATAGKYLKTGMQNADDPVKKILNNVDEYQSKLVAGVQEAAKRGNYKAGLQKAADRNAWSNSVDRAASHYEERASDMVDNALSDYDQRAAAIERAKKAVSSMPTTTREQRIAKSAAYQKAVGAEFDKLYGRK